MIRHLYLKMQASLRQLLQGDDDKELLDDLVARGLDVDAAATKVLPGYTLEVMRAVGIPMKFWARMTALSRPGTQQTRVLHLHPPGAGTHFHFLS